MVEFISIMKGLNKDIEYKNRKVSRDIFKYSSFNIDITEMKRAEQSS